jgi:hypothetical protein
MTKANPDRQLAKVEGRKFYIGGTACKKCGCVIKFVSSYGCHYCGKIKGRQRLAEGVCDKYHTPEKTKARVDRWRKNNPDKYREQWRRRDKAKNAEMSNRYRCQKLNQTPDLTTEEKSAIMEVYSLARRLTLETGVKHEVDHIIPVSKGGLHHPDNLQVLTKYDNQSKGNRQK